METPLKAKKTGLFFDPFLYCNLLLHITLISEDISTATKPVLGMYFSLLIIIKLKLTI